MIVDILLMLATVIIGIPLALVFSAVVIYVGLALYNMIFRR